MVEIDWCVIRILPSGFIASYPSSYRQNGTNRIVTIDE